MPSTEGCRLRGYAVEWILVPSTIEIGGALEAKLLNVIHVCVLIWEGLVSQVYTMG